MKQNFNGLRRQPRRPRWQVPECYETNPVKVNVNNANRTAVLDQEGKVLPGAAEVRGKENDIHIAKIGWLSKKDTGKA